MTIHLDLTINLRAGCWAYVIRCVYTGCFRKNGKHVIKQYSSDGVCSYHEYNDGYCNYQDKAPNHITQQRGPCTECAVSRGAMNFSEQCVSLTMV
jgi:hypothetical protein